MYQETLEDSDNHKTEAQKRYEKRMYSLKEYVDVILHRKIDSNQQIEPILEQLLDFISEENKGMPEFKHLNDYYKGLNPERADYYRRWYNDILARKENGGD